MTDLAEASPITSVLEVTAMNPAARADPYPLLAEVQRRCPVLHDPIAGTTLVTRYADVRALANDRTLWRSPEQAEEGAAVRRLIRDPGGDGERVGSILMMDDPDHKRIREPFAQALYARVAKGRGEVEATVAQVLDGVAGRPSFDLIGEVAIPIPILVIARILGVEESRLGEFRAWSEAVILFLHPLPSEEQQRRMQAGADALTAYFAELMAARRAQPREDLISDMVGLQAAGAPLSDAEVRANLIALLVGGNLTTTDLIGNGLRLLLTHPEQLEALRADPSLAGAAVEEVLRFDSPVDVTGRIARGAREVGGTTLPDRRSMTLSLRAANRDPAAFDAPERFDIARSHTPHVAFGGGAHICIGAPLARIEARAAFTQLLARFPTLRLADEAPQWRSLPFFRGMERLVLETG